MSAVGLAVVVGIGIVAGGSIASATSDTPADRDLLALLGSGSAAIALVVRIGTLLWRARPSVRSRPVVAGTGRSRAR